MAYPVYHCHRYCFIILICSVLFLLASSYKWLPAKHFFTTIQVCQKNLLSLVSGWQFYWSGSLVTNNRIHSVQCNWIYDMLVASSLYHWIREKLPLLRLEMWYLLWIWTDLHTNVSTRMLGSSAGFKMRPALSLFPLVVHCWISLTLVQLIVTMQVLCLTHNFKKSWEIWRRGYQSKGDRITMWVLCLEKEFAWCWITVKRYAYHI